MSNLDLESSRGSRAKTILEDELFIETIKSLKETYTEAIFQTGPNDELARTKIYLAYQILGKFENHFRSTMETGKLASKQLDELRKNK
jgi:hypothetical protein|tara:strand:+ start:2192 stop:2455 length:264 start_codon:yes stop_codon:yes gene_type:complete